ncbi:MAG: hypothetical protein WCI67_00705 [Chloroflexales bacterium]
MDITSLEPKLIQQAIEDADKRLVPWCSWLQATPSFGANPARVAALAIDLQKIAHRVDNLACYYDRPGDEYRQVQLYRQTRMKIYKMIEIIDHIRIKKQGSRDYARHIADHLCEFQTFLSAMSHVLDREEIEVDRKC